MGDEKRERQKTNRQARIAAMEEARRKAARKRQAITIAAIIVVVVAVLALLNRGGDDDGDDVAAGNTSTSVAVDDTSASSESAAGKPCVALADPLPEGAPEVPVKVGPPPTELIVEDLSVGTGAEVAKGANVKAHYIGVSCSTGKIFDSSYSRGEPADFSLNEVVQGWTDGIPGMKVGGRRLLGIPADQAYGAAGRPGTIAPDEALWFVVEIVETS